MLFVIIRMLFFFAVCESKHKKERKDERDVFGGEIYCLQQSRLIKLDQNGEVLIVPVKEAGSILLKCGFCDTETIEEPRVWVRWDLGTNIKQEIQQGDRVSETLSKSLIIKNVSSTDSAIYLCKMYYEDSLETSFNFLVDTIEENDFWNGNILLWLNYSQTYYTPVNSRLTQRSYYLESSKTAVHVEAIPSWTSWSECQICIKNPKQFKKARCHIKAALLAVGNNETVQNLMGEKAQRTLQIMLETMVALPCRGSLAKNLLPELTALIGEIPDFQQTIECQPSCPKKGSYGGPRQRGSMVLEAGSNAVVPCPGSFRLGTVRWEHNKRRINVGELDGSITVDHFGALHLVSVTKWCSGNYTCFAPPKDTRMLELTLRVKSNMLGLQAGFGRHVFYLATITLLSFTVFFIILVGAYIRKKRVLRLIGARDYSRLPLFENEEGSETE